MAKTSLQIQSTLQTTGKKITTNISNVNNSATSATMRQLAVKLNDLTTNEYYQADAIKRYNVDTEEATPKPTPTLRLVPNTTVPVSGTSSQAFIPISAIETNSDGEVYGVIVTNAKEGIIKQRSETEYSVWTFNTQTVGSTYDVILFTTETENFTAASATGTLTTVAQ